MSKVPTGRKPRKRRADATRNIDAILDAAAIVLTERPDASMDEVARAAGVARQTVYAHYSSRELLLDAVLVRAAAEIAAAMDAAGLSKGPPKEALLRFLEFGWQTLERHHALMSNPAAPMTPSEMHERMAPINERLGRLIRRGQRAGVFDRGVSAEWLLAATVALAHAASEEVRSGRMKAKAATRSLELSVLRLLDAE
jgi:AcrR family transcriptional regulator